MPDCEKGNGCSGGMISKHPEARERKGSVTIAEECLTERSTLLSAGSLEQRNDL